MSMSVVIGANYGDEGKGLITDYLSDDKTTVVRFNGGAQAGHTVVTPDGHRHVFHHFGSGTFRGARTFLSHHFVVNPILFVREFRELEKAGLFPIVYIDPRCPVTTPYDMMLNQAVERKRGNARHGSCGMGINETLTRHENPEYQLTYRDFFKGGTEVRRKLMAIRSGYTPHRAHQLGVEDLMGPVFDEGVFDHYIEDVTLLIHKSSPRFWESGIWSEHIVFEGAQGLRLDMDSPDFPHVTRSKTGLHNVLDLLNRAGMTKDPVNVYYVTRTYVTRHGAGPLPHELSSLPYSKVKDDTNIPNPYQGTIRYGWLDTTLLAETVLRDFPRNVLNLNLNLAITCADQLDNERVKFVQNGHLMEKPLGAVMKALYSMMHFGECLVAQGPSRADVLGPKTEPTKYPCSIITAA